MSRRAIANLRGSSEPLSLGLAANPTRVVTNARSTVGLAGSPSAGEGTPAAAAQQEAVKASRPTVERFTFADAAMLRGHDVTSVGSASDARHDHRVWDLIEGVNR